MRMAREHLAPFLALPPGIWRVLMRARGSIWLLVQRGAFGGRRTRLTQGSPRQHWGAPGAAGLVGGVEPKWRAWSRSGGRGAEVEGVEPK